MNRVWLLREPNPGNLIQFDIVLELAALTSRPNGHDTYSNAVAIMTDSVEETENRTLSPGRFIHNYGLLTPPLFCVFKYQHGATWKRWIWNIFLRFWCEIWQLGIKETTSSYRHASWLAHSYPSLHPVIVKYSHLSSNCMMNWTAHIAALKWDLTVYSSHFQTT